MAPPPDTPPPAEPKQTGTSGGGGMGFVMDTINSAIALVKNPVAFIEANKNTPWTVKEIMIKYVAVLALIPFFATIIGDLWYYGFYVVYRLSGSYFTYAFVYAIVVYILDVGAVYVMGIVIKMLAPTFGSTPDEIKSLKLAAYIYTPAFLISILNIIPFLGVVTILGLLYGLYILYLGLPILLGTPKDKVVTYVIGVVVAAVIVYLVKGAIVGAITAAVFLASFHYF